MERYAEAEDVAKLAAFLVSDDASFITGEWWRMPHTHVVLKLGRRLSMVNCRPICELSPANANLPAADLEPVALQYIVDGGGTFD